MKKIKEIKIQNFKAFQEVQSFPINSKNSKKHFHRALTSASQPHSCFVWYHRLVPIPKHNVAGSIYLLLGQNEMVAKKLIN